MSPDQSKSDHWIWLLENSKVFSVSSFYKLLNNSGAKVGMDSELNCLLENVWTKIDCSVYFFSILTSILTVL